MFVVSNGSTAPNPPLIFNAEGSVAKLEQPAAGCIRSYALS